MNSLLPTTGTNALLEQLCPFVPDGFLRDRWPHTATGGRPGHLSAAQWWRVHLLAPLLEGLDPSVPIIALIDATDLPAACRDFKKVDRHLLHRARRAGRAYAQDRSEPLLRRLQETYAAIVALVAYGTRAVGAVEQWFGAVEEDALCPCCWQQSDCFSLRLTWCWGLLADAVCLLRARTLRTLRPSNHPLVELLPEQLTMEWDEAV